MGEIIERPVRGAAFHAEGEWAIPEGYEAEIKDGKIIVRKKESEDERTRKAIMSALERAREAHSLVGLELERAGVTYHEVFAWLEKQKEQQPAEWSKEEVAIIDGIIQDVRNTKMRAEEDVDYPTTKEELDAYDEEVDFLNRLKSLRPQPHWKPSEAQKNALKEVLDMAEAYGILQKMGRTYDDIIELQNDLEEEF
jgi:uncharacterized protein YpuA (DUF1002 family)